jgi:putative transposase
MARLPRYVIPGQPQHIIQRGNNRQVIFAAEADYQFFRDALVEAAEKHGLLIHAYVWMTNHIHILATPRFENSISKVFQSVGRKYVQYFNHTYKRSGTLWEGRYRATVVDSEQYLLKVMQYIELNPVRAKMALHPADYPWSSYAYHANGKMGKNYDWLQPHSEYLRLGREHLERQVAYQALFKTEMKNDDLKQIRDSTHKGWVLGSRKFIEEIEILCQRQGSSKGRGRPKKANIVSDPI